ncbi:hypothetical protein I6F15_27925 [Bradyrhizobium sp. BRP14]|nr:hypothetical protein [Bradyrhizobium sp. BRP14]
MRNFVIVDITGAGCQRMVKSGKLWGGLFRQQSSALVLAAEISQTLTTICALGTPLRRKFQSCNCMAVGG